MTGSLDLCRMETMDKDLEHLRLLSIFHYVFGGLTALFGCFPCIYLAFGIAFVSGAAGLPGMDPYRGGRIVNYFLLDCRDHDPSCREVSRSAAPLYVLFRGRCDRVRVYPPTGRCWAFSRSSCWSGLRSSLCLKLSRPTPHKAAGFGEWTARSGEQRAGT